MDEQRWRRVRAHLVQHRYGLALRAFGPGPSIVDAPLLVRPEWIPDRPIPLRSVELEHRPAAEPAILATAPRYADTLVAAGAPLRDLPTYRLIEAELRDRPRLRFGDGHYFDGLDVGEAAAHEYAAVELGELSAPVLREAVGDPTDLTRRPANLAVSALTLRQDGDEVTMPLHRRDPAKVGHAGGMIQVIPVGVFQPIGPEPWNVAADFDLWRLLLREYAEELLGAPEDYDTSTGPYDYAAWPFGARMTAGLDAGEIRAFVLGLGVDPLTYATDLLAAVVFDSGTYDELFADAVAVNDEGAVLPAVPFTAAQVDRYAAHEPTQAAGAALLRLAWRHRESLLTRPAGDPERTS